MIGIAQRKRQIIIALQHWPSLDQRGNKTYGILVISYRQKGHWSKYVQRKLGKGFLDRDVKVISNRVAFIDSSTKGRSISGRDRLKESRLG